MDKQQGKKPQHIEQITIADNREEKAQQCVKRIHDLADHLKYVAELCEAGDRVAWYVCGQLEKELNKLQNSLTKAIPQDINIRINFVEAAVPVVIKTTEPDN